MKKLLFVLAAITLFQGLTFAEDITTVDGTTYKDVSIEGTNPSGIDIGYTNVDGNYVLRGLKFTNLPENIQKRFGYKPELSQQFETKVNAYSSTEMDDVASAQKARLETIIKEIKQKLAGADVNIKPDDLRYAAFALRRTVKVNPVASIRQGCVVDIEEVTSGKPISSKRILLDGVSLPAGTSWTGYIYPTGVQSTYQNVNGIPVFTESVSRSVDIANKYLNIYGEYAASEQGQSATPPQDIPAPDQGSPDNAAVADSSSSDSTSASSSYPMSDSSTDYVPQTQIAYAPADGYGCTYYMGGNYCPVNWYWRHHNYPHPRPNPLPRTRLDNRNDRQNIAQNAGQSREKTYEQSINNAERRFSSSQSQNRGNYSGQSMNRVGNFHQSYSGGGMSSGGTRGGGMGGMSGMRGGGGGGGRR